MPSKAFFIFFLLASVGDLVCVWFELPYRPYTKSLIIPTLILYFISSSPKTKSFYLFVIAMVFAWLGDVLLLFSGEQFFLFGLCSFLIMQFLYSIIFFKERENQTIKVLLSALILIVFSVGFNYYLWSFTSAVRIPVIAYAIAISIMAFTGINRKQDLSGYYYICLGVVLFVISDTVLAINNFAEGFWKGGFIVMLTYILAQFCIAEGYAKYLRSSV